ncbi:leucine-rich repeat domain-containing protein [Chaetoceros tenuissimus]|uniref:Leucine-rich repeat domain-containing protein n=1 Tax=Chaetoceros tenuissimus TaxID=426638 RepID=A0AAD3CQE9_9STRA|nr:leucine-rich repeat domain-containing protein [Chaetoceros tenuissimus]
MRVQTEEWQRFVPGVRMYKGKKTLFWNGEKIWDNENTAYLIYSREEQRSWEVVIVLPGVRVIHRRAFSMLEKLQTVFMSEDSVETIEEMAFDRCENLSFVKFSRNLEYIGYAAFYQCRSLTSIFIPPSCREIGNKAFCGCRKLIIFHVSRQTQLGGKAITNTALFKTSPIEVDDRNIRENVNAWISNINGDDDEFALHRACSSFNPIAGDIIEIVKRQGLISFKRKNQIGITPLEYLEANPFAEHIDQCSFVKRYMLEMMGETV